MIKELVFSKNRSLVEKLLFFFFYIYPISFLTGNFLINLFSLIIFLLFLYEISFNKIKIFQENKLLIILLFLLFTTLIINLFFSNNFNLSYPRVLKFIVIIGFILSFRQLIRSFNEKEMNQLYKFWSVILLIVVVDLIFEFFFKSNILGFKSHIPGRLSSFMGSSVPESSELVIGHFFSAFCLIALSYIHLNYKNKSINILIALFFILISFLIGERSNFIKTIIIITLFVFFIYDIKLKFKLLSIPIIFLLFFSILSLNDNYKLRYFTQISKIGDKNIYGISSYLENSIYGAHYKVAEEIFKDNPFFGVGIKNFRVESFSNKYDDLDHKLKDRRGNTHPHQVHYELLAETGLFGYLTFVIFIFFSFYLFFKSYRKKKNIYQFSGMLFVMISLVPLLPSGSFFSTYSAGLFWINYSIMIGYLNKDTKF